LRRNGLYAAQLSGWRRQHAERGLDGLQAQAPRRRMADPRHRRIHQLQRENSRLHRRVEVAEQLIELQKKSLPTGRESPAGETLMRLIASASKGLSNSASVGR
jgi:transposase-like protein